MDGILCSHPNPAALGLSTFMPTRELSLGWDFLMDIRKSQALKFHDHRLSCYKITNIHAEFYHTYSLQPCEMSFPNLLIKKCN